MQRITAEAVTSFPALFRRRVSISRLAELAATAVPALVPMLHLSADIPIERSVVMKKTALFFCAVVISCTAVAVIAQESAQQPNSLPPATRPSGVLTPDQLLPLPQPVPPVPAPTTTAAPPPIVYVPTLSSSSTACTGGGSANSPSTGSGVSVSQLPRAGVPADAFTRPGVSTAQLNTMTPSASSSGMNTTACGQQSGGSVWYPDPLPPPKPLLAPPTDSSAP